MRVVIDSSKCTGHGRCYDVAPDLFTDDERGYGQVVDGGVVREGLEDQARWAVRACPEHAIEIVEE